MTMQIRRERRKEGERSLMEVRYLRRDMDGLGAKGGGGE